MHNDRSVEHPEVKTPTEARQGQVSKGAPIRRVLMISIALTVVAFLIIYLAFAE